MKGFPDCILPSSYYWVGLAIVYYIVREGGGGENFPGNRVLSISLEKGELEIWWRAFQTVFCPLLTRFNCLVDTGVSDQLPLDPLLELLPRCFLPSELSSSSDLEAEESELGADKEQLGLLLIFDLLERSDLRDPWVLFFRFLFKS